MSTSSTQIETTSTPPSKEGSVDVVEVELTVLDQFYYVSNASGDTFSTKPYILHTALYYAFGLLPSRFRTESNTPDYLEHFENSTIARDVYIHPATTRTDPEYTTRRFACKDDQYRSATTPENKNLKETGHQTFINPGTTFRTFLVIAPESDLTATNLTDELDSYIRVGKKMTSTRVETYTHRTTIESGEFTLGQPIATNDLDRSQVNSFQNIRYVSFPHLDLIKSCVMNGEYITIEPVTSHRENTTETVSLPINTSFLGQ